MNTLLKQQSKPKQIRKGVQILINSPQYKSYMDDLDNISVNFWSSPSPNTDFERFKLGSDMLPPFTPPENSKLLSVFSKKHNKNTVKSIKLDTDFTNSNSISIQDDLIFNLE